MTRSSTFIRLAAAISMAVTLAACTDEADIIVPQVNDPLFTSYVAMGNSITAGFQSGGINDSTQRESFARLLAIQMGTRYAYPSMVNPGCPPPIIDFTTQAREGGGTNTTCLLRDTASVTAALNNVAVPGATSFDPTSFSTSASNALTTFILGGQTQAARAVQVNPTFATVWIGNNDVLAAALTGLLVPTPNVSPGVTPIAQFETNYDTMITVLKTAPRLQGAVLIGVVQVAAAPALFPASALFIPAFKLGLDQAVGRTILIDPSCIGSTSLISMSIVSFLRTPTNPAIIACTPQGVPGGLGDIFVLDPTEQTTLTNIIASYNNKIQSVATANGWAFWDPNPLLQTLKTRGCIATVPNIGSATNPFGLCVSLDGVHPSGLAHKEITNALVGVINSKYFTSLQTIPIP